MHRIAIFASGNGSNAENIIRHFSFADRNARVALVVTNRADAGVLRRAAGLGVPAEVLTRGDISNPDSLLPLLERHGVDFIVLAGFLLMVPVYLVRRYSRRIVNIHPALLPKFGGKGMYGINVHRAVVNARETKTGITVHYVSEHYDEGEIIFQASVAVSPTDTPEDVEAKIHLLEAEHFPSVVEKVIDGLPDFA